MPRKAKKVTRYKDYCVEKDGELYGSINIPNGDGTYRQKRKKVDSVTEARQWALGELAKLQHGKVELTKTATFGELAAWYKREYLIEPVYENGIKVEGVKDHKRLKAKI